MPFLLQHLPEAWPWAKSGAACAQRSHGLL